MLQVRVPRATNLRQVWMAPDDGGPVRGLVLRADERVFLRASGHAAAGSPADVLKRLSSLRPYPAAGTRSHYQAVYAVTHIVYVLNDYDERRLSSRVLPRERAFLAASLPPALARNEPDTVAEIVEALAALGVSDTHPLIEAGRGFLLTAQGPDGGWGDRADSYGRFHTIWAAIDGLRDHAWTRRPSPALISPILTASRRRASTTQTPERDTQRGRSPTSRRTS